MISKHEMCIFPNNSGIKIWRYLDFTKFVDLLNSKSLYFSRFDKFDDIFEGSLPKESVIARSNQLNSFGLNSNSGIQSVDFWNNIGIKFKKEFAANCWHMNEHESAAMWKVYLKTNEGVAIQSTYKRLYECLNLSSKPIYLSIIKYIDFESDIINWGNRMSTFVHKRKSYTFEQELRAIVRKVDGYDLSKGGCKVDIDLNNLIENVYIAPSSPTWFRDLVIELLKNYKLSIANSKLDDKPIY
jgi:hypothetical protein